VADVVLVEANPLEDVANLRRIRAVIANGRVYDDAARRALIERAAVAGSRQ
jgi:imidazolonepropionase-like amidohydrolase